ncbi:MAG: hypothetical protein RLZZ437_1227 [Pseudomonadota bacterium]|jgi:ABC-type multidrug transport system fused ATPase/permease subunit
MTVPPLFGKGRAAVWAGLASLTLAQAAALVAGVTGTRLAFASLESGAMSTLALGLIAGAALGLAGLRPAVRLMAEHIGQGQTIAIRSALYLQAMAASPERLAGRRRGYLMLRLTGDMSTLKDGVTRSLPLILQAAALIPAGLLALTLIDPRFAMAGAVLTGVTLVVMAVTSGSLRNAHQALRSTRAKLVADMAERLPIAPELARLGRRRAEVARLAVSGRALHRKAAARLMRAEGLRAVPAGLAGLCAVAVLWDGAHRGLPAGEIAAALAALGVMGHALVELAGAIDRLAGWQIARQTLARHLAEATATDPPDPTVLVRLRDASGQLSVTAAPGLMTPAELVLAPGDRGAIAAADADVLLRLLSGQETHPDVTVKLDGIALSALTPGSIRRAVGMMTASPVLLKGSVRRNICLGLTERPSDATLLRRIAKADLAPTLARFGGLDGAVPESGRTFGLADRLRLSALRVAVQRPKVLLLSAAGVPLPHDLQAFLDSRTETVVRLYAVTSDLTAVLSPG